MNTSINDGGPAFPSTATCGGYTEIRTGMSLRAYFAGQAIIGLTNGRKDYVATFAKEAVSIADALIAELNKTEPK